MQAPGCHLWRLLCLPYLRTASPCVEMGENPFSAACSQHSQPGPRTPTLYGAPLQHFDFAINLVGTGMICSHAVNWRCVLPSWRSFYMLPPAPLLPPRLASERVTP